MGVLGLPYAFSYLRWVGGLLFLATCFVTSLYTSSLLAALHEAPDGTRRNRYKDLGKAIFGEPAAWRLQPPGCGQAGACKLRVLVPLDGAHRPH